MQVHSLGKPIIKIRSDDPLHAARVGDLESMKRLVEKDVTVVYQKDPRGRTPLFFAKKNGHLALADYLRDVIAHTATPRKSRLTRRTTRPPNPREESYASRVARRKKKGQTLTYTLDEPSAPLQDSTTFVDEDEISSDENEGGDEATSRLCESLVFDEVGSAAPLPSFRPPNRSLNGSLSSSLFLTKLKEKPSKSRCSSSLASSISGLYPYPSIAESRSKLKGSKDEYVAETCEPTASDFMSVTTSSYIRRLKFSYACEQPSEAAVDINKPVQSRRNKIKKAEQLESAELSLYNWAQKHKVWDSMSFRYSKKQRILLKQCYNTLKNRTKDDDRAHKTDIADLFIITGIAHNHKDNKEIVDLLEKNASGLTFTQFLSAVSPRIFAQIKRQKETAENFYGEESKQPARVPTAYPMNMELAPEPTSFSEFHRAQSRHAFRSQSRSRFFRPTEPCGAILTVEELRRKFVPRLHPSDPLTSKQNIHGILRFIENLDKSPLSADVLTEALRRRLIMSDLYNKYTYNEESLAQYRFDTAIADAERRRDFEAVTEIQKIRAQRSHVLLMHYDRLRAFGVSVRRQVEIDQKHNSPKFPLPEPKTNADDAIKHVSRVFKAYKSRDREMTKSEFNDMLKGVTLTQSHKEILQGSGVSTKLINSQIIAEEVNKLISSMAEYKETEVLDRLHARLAFHGIAGDPRQALLEWIPSAEKSLHRKVLELDGTKRTARRGSLDDVILDRLEQRAPRQRRSSIAKEGEAISYHVGLLELDNSPNDDENKDQTDQREDSMETPSSDSRKSRTAELLAMAKEGRPRTRLPESEGEVTGGALLAMANILTGKGPKKHGESFSFKSDYGG